MAGPKGQVCNMTMMSLLVIGLILITFILDYMTYTEFVDVGLQKATYHFIHNEDASFVRGSFGSISSTLCPLTDAEVSNLSDFCELIPDFQIAGLLYIVSACLAIASLTYVTAYLIAIGIESSCASSFYPGLGQLTAVIIYLIAVALPLILSHFLDYYAEGKSVCRAGMVLMVATLVVLLASSLYYLAISRTGLAILHQKLEAERKTNPLAMPLLGEHKDQPPAEATAQPTDMKDQPTAPLLTDKIEPNSTLVAT